MTNKRISYIDMAKGLGILLVVMGHLGFASESLLTWIMSFHMPLFFILSGMLLSHTNAAGQGMSAFLRKKVKTILFPYFTFSLLSILFSAVLDFSTFGTDFPYMLLETVTFYGISVLWFLPALFFGEVLFLFIRRHTSLAASAAICVCLCLITVFAANTYHYHYVIDTGSYLNLLGVFLITVFVRSGMAVTFLAIGYYSHLFFFKKEKTAPSYAAFSILFLALNIFLTFKNGKVDLNYLVFNNYALYFSAAFCGSMFLICLCAALPAWKPLVFIGKNSLIIMATHMNCRFLGICYAAGNLLLQLVPEIGQTGYRIAVVICMFVLEAIAIYVINHFFPVIIGAERTGKI